MYETMVQLNSDATPLEAKRVKREEVSHQDGGQDIRSNGLNIKKTRHKIIDIDSIFLLQKSWSCTVLDLPRVAW